MKEQFIFKDAPFASCHASTIVEIKPNVLLVAFFGGSAEGAEDVAIWLARYENSHWKELKKVAFVDHIPCWNPVIFKFDSKYVLSYKVGFSPREWTGFLKFSDDGVNWSESLQLPAGILGPTKNKPIVLENGEWLCGSSIESWRAWTCWIDYTSDFGKTWQKFGPIRAAIDSFGIIQPALFFDRNKILHLLARSKNIGYICHATSIDQGRTWSEVRVTNLPNPNSALDAVCLQDGRIVVIYNHSKQLERSYDDLIPTQGRERIDLAISMDNGQSWQHAFTIEEGEGEYSYPAVIQASDGLIHLTYTWKRQRIKHVIFDPKEL